MRPIGSSLPNSPFVFSGTTAFQMPSARRGSPNAVATSACIRIKARTVLTSGISVTRCDGALVFGTLLLGAKAREQLQGFGGGGVPRFARDIKGRLPGC